MENQDIMRGLACDELLKRFGSNEGGLIDRNQGSASTQT
jgi:hypothetical protein